MLSIRHSIGKTPLLEHMANDSKSVAHFRCYAIAPPTGVYALSTFTITNAKLIRSGFYTTKFIQQEHLVDLTLEGLLFCCPCEIDHHFLHYMLQITTVDF